MTIKPIRTITSLCTALALSSPAMAHDGAHEFSFVGSVLHELSHADYLLAALAAIVALGAAWRLTRRKGDRTGL